MGANRKVKKVKQQGKKKKSRISCDVKSMQSKVQLAMMRKGESQKVGLLRVVALGTMIGNFYHEH